METENFEEKLRQMTKPEVTYLKHQDMLADAIIRANDKSALSWWWISIPLYIIAAFIMKSMFMPQATLVSSIHTFAHENIFLSVFLFLIIPLCFILLNFFTIRKIFKLSGNIFTLKLIEIVWLNFLVIAACIFILLIYFF